MKIRDYLEDAGIPYVEEGHRHCRPGWIHIDCPNCGPDSGKYHFGIFLRTGAASCWRCGPMNTAAALARSSSLSRSAWRRLLEDGLALSPRENERDKRAQGRYRPPRSIGPLTPAHGAYLRRRGFDPDELVRLWGLRGIANAPRFAWSLFVPHFYRGKPVSWQVRSCRPDARIRWMSASPEEEELSYKSLLYGSDYAGHAVVVVEGASDAWAIGPGAVATCGTGYTSAQLLRLSAYSARTICFDAEPAAQARARQLAAALAPFPGVTRNVQLETGSDAAEADLGEVEELRRAFL